MQPRYSLDRAQLAALVREKRARFTLREAAPAIGMSASTLSRIERQVGQLPDIGTFLTLCTWLDVHPADVITDMQAEQLLLPPTTSSALAFALAGNSRIDPAVCDALRTIICALEGHNDAEPLPCLAKLLDCLVVAVAAARAAAGLR